MEEQFDLPVEYKGVQHSFKSTLFVFGYTHKIQINVNGVIILFEPDEERKYRAVVNDLEANSNKKIDIELLKKISETLEGFLK